MQRHSLMINGPPPFPSRILLATTITEHVPLDPWTLEHPARRPLSFSGPELLYFLPRGLTNLDGSISIFVLSRPLLVVSSCSASEFGSTPAFVMPRLLQRNTTTEAMTTPPWPRCR